MSSPNVRTSGYLVNISSKFSLRTILPSSSLSPSYFGATTGTFDHDGELKAGALSSSLSGSHVSLKFPTFTFEYGRRIATGLAQEAGQLNSQ